MLKLRVLVSVSGTARDQLALEHTHGTSLAQRRAEAGTAAIHSARKGAPLADHSRSEVIYHPASVKFRCRMHSNSAAIETMIVENGV